MLYKELAVISQQQYKSSHATLRHKAELQIAFCRSVGFGVEKDADIAVHYLLKAAEGGLEEAMAISLRFPLAIGVAIPKKSRTTDWLSRATLSGSRIAARDLFDHFPKQYAELRQQQAQALRSSLGLKFGEMLQDLADGIPLPMRTSSASYINQFLDAITGKPSDLMSWLYENHYNAYLNFLSGGWRGKMPGDNPLISAVKIGDFQLTNYILGFEVELNSPITSKATALHWVCTLPEPEAIDLAISMINKEPSLVNQETTSECQISSNVDHFFSKIPPGSTPLRWAISYDLSRLVKALLEKGARLYGSRYTPQLPVASAARCLSSRTLVELLHWHGEGDVNMDVNGFDERGLSAFYYALRPDILNRMIRYIPVNLDSRSDSARKLKIDTVTALLKRGTDLRVQEKDNFGCFHLSVFSDDIEITCLLLQRLEANKWINWPPVRVPTGIYAEAIPSPLGLAVLRGNIKCVQKLIQHGASLKDAIPSQSLHALHLCPPLDSSVMVEIARTIMQKDPHCANARSNRGLTPLHTCALSGNISLLHFLVECGASPLVYSGFQYSDRGLTPLGIAVLTRSVAGVHAIANELHRNKLPFEAHREAGVGIIDAISFLLTPGDFSIVTSGEGLGNGLTGCFDFPFSRSSQIILNVLLHFYQETPILNFRSLPSVFEHTRPALLPFVVVRSGDVKLVKKVLGSRIPSQWFHSLVNTALLQFEIGRMHIATDEARLEMFQYLRELESEKYQALKADRLRTSICVLLRTYWWVRYAINEEPRHLIRQRSYDKLLEERNDPQRVHHICCKGQFISLDPHVTKKSHFLLLGSYVAYASLPILLIIFFTLCVYYSPRSFSGGSYAAFAFMILLVSVFPDLSTALS